jgi:hypothetical protein
VANSGLRETVAGQVMHIEVLTAHVEALAELKRQPDMDSATSRRPPSSDPYYRKPARRSEPGPLGSLTPASGPFAAAWPVTRPNRMRSAGLRDSSEVSRLTMT